MSTSSQEELRLKQRSTVNLKALFSLRGKKAQDEHCMITNLSATGARIQCEPASPLKIGMKIKLKISIPNTIMHIPNSGEIMWVEQQFNSYLIGIKFTEFLSETMMQQILKDDYPASQISP